MFDFFNMVSQLEQEILEGMDEADTNPVITLFADPPAKEYWNPGPNMRNNATPRGPSPLDSAHEEYCEGDWLMVREEWEALIGNDPTALPFCCIATEALRRAIIRIRDWGPSKIRYDQLTDHIDTLTERHFLPEENLVYELVGRMEEWCYDTEDTVWGM